MANVRRAEQRERKGGAEHEHFFCCVVLFRRYSVLKQFGKLSIKDPFILAGVDQVRQR